MTGKPLDNSMTASQPLVLASSSPYRQELMNRLGLGFSSVSPDIDEEILPGESAEDLVRRLSTAKAEIIAKRFQDAIVIGSDQALALDSEILGKPGEHESAVKQLQKLSGQQVVFYTGLSVINARTAVTRTDCIPYRVCFRKLSDDEIQRYLEAEKPYQCAGSFKSEGMGIALLESMEGSDPTALIGLPLIRLAEMLRMQGLKIP